jgi:hypothetical protein
MANDKGQEKLIDVAKLDVYVIGVMKSGNPFQLGLGRVDVRAAAERVALSMKKGDVEIIEGEALCVVRWGEMESAVVMTHAELEKRSRMQAIAGGGMPGPARRG